MSLRPPSLLRRALRSIPGPSRIPYIARPAPRLLALSTSRRGISTTFPRRRDVSAEPLDEIPIKTISASEYEDISDHDMDILHESLETLCEDHPSGQWEVEYSSGVLTLSIPPHGTYVINKQPPNHQIWLSSPVSGPARFGLSPDGKWVHCRIPRVTLASLVEDEIRKFIESDGTALEWEGLDGLK
ncbi:hypothetical protein BCR39DRAFT_513579 [Naematelia encephala]|uniref:ferroxidase n=1 Tax=Naematelia encephala TaxID=71784 RepID=A0A1Y2BKI1_9TREE|nr:hypothetical protein BCR39DRAFT_513579 [Naematelia encephala]